MEQSRIQVQAAFVNCRHDGVGTVRFQAVRTAELDIQHTEVSRQTTINLPPRLRMSTLYAISQSMNGRVANTCTKTIHIIKLIIKPEKKIFFSCL